MIMVEIVDTRALTRSQSASAGNLFDWPGAVYLDCQPNKTLGQCSGIQNQNVDLEGWLKFVDFKYWKSQVILELCTSYATRALVLNNDIVGGNNLGNMTHPEPPGLSPLPSHAVLSAKKGGLRSVQLWRQMNCKAELYDDV